MEWLQRSHSKHLNISELAETGASFLSQKDVRALEHSDRKGRALGMRGLFHLFSPLIFVNLAAYGASDGSILFNFWCFLFSVVWYASNSFGNLQELAGFLGY